MRPRVYCPVCQSHFVPREPLEKGSMVTCSVCGALIEILEVSPEIGSQKAIQEPLEEITQSEGLRPPQELRVQVQCQ
jgi:DNA-directed RNA polymerase subunit M/transcription elongation factor TFIIS